MHSPDGIAFKFARNASWSSPWTKFKTQIELYRPMQLIGFFHIRLALIIVTFLNDKVGDVLVNENISDITDMGTFMQTEI